MKSYENLAAIGIDGDLFLCCFDRGLYRSIEQYRSFARPLKSVPEDFLKCSVSTVLSKFFRVTLSQRHTYVTMILLSNPRLRVVNIK